ncbi:hypothetical protein N7488_003010 [Penicillium malachiteum]|nr:hypothetical protein N7488_003010 [Penicillium malachiteum]
MALKLLLQRTCRWVPEPHKADASSWPLGEKVTDKTKLEWPLKADASSWPLGEKVTDKTKLEWPLKPYSVIPRGQRQQLTVGREGH